MSVIELEIFKGLPPSEVQGISSPALKRIVLLIKTHKRMQKAISQWMKECRIEFTDAEIDNDPEMQELLEALDDANELMKW